MTVELLLNHSRNGRILKSTVTWKLKPNPTPCTKESTSPFIWLRARVIFVHPCGLFIPHNFERRSKFSGRAFWFSKQFIFTVGNSKEEAMWIQMSHAIGLNFFLTDRKLFRDSFLDGLLFKGR